MAHSRNVRYWFDAESPGRFLLLLYFSGEPTTFDMAGSTATADKAVSVTRTANFGAPAVARTRLARLLSIALLTCAVAIIVYGSLAPLAAGRLAQGTIAQLGPNTGEWTVRVDRVRFEPFTLAFNLDDVQIVRVDGSVVAGIRLAHVDFSLSSVVQARPVLNRLDIRGSTLHGGPEAVTALWSLLEPLSRGAHVAALGAEFALTSPDVDHGSPSFTLRGTDIDLSNGRGTFVANANDPVGAGSHLDAEIVAQRAEGGARLRGTATVTRGQLALGDWTIAAPSAVISIDTKLSPTSVAASFSLLRGPIVAVDERTPDARFQLINGSATTVWQPVGGFREVRTNGVLADGGRAELALIQGTGETRHLNVNLTAVPAAELAPYARRALGVEPDGGTIDIELSTETADSAVVGFARIVARDLRLAADEPSVRTAIAVLEDTEGAISLNLPLAAEPRAGEQMVGHVAARVLAVAAAPFAALASLVGRDAADISVIEFVPGSPEPTEGGRESLAALAAVLHERTRVGVTLRTGEGAGLDRAALARSQVMLHVTLATAQTEHTPRAVEIDFAWQRAQEVLDEFARERLDAATLEEIDGAFGSGATGQAAEASERVAYYRALFEALVAREPIADATLERLATFRVRVIQAELGQQGIDLSRVADDGDTAGLANDELLAVLPLAVEPAMLPQAPRQ
jgi:hypothetical protein